MRREWTLVATLAAVVALAGCGRTVDVGSVRDVTAPSFAPRPSTPGDSPQLAALELRAAGNVQPMAESADASSLPTVLDALLRERPGITELTRLSIYDNTIHVTFIDPQDPTLATRSAYFAHDGELRIQDAVFNEDDSFPLAAVRPRVPARLVRNIERRFPSTRVTSVDMRVSLSYGFGLAWYLTVDDARGELASVYADLDGTIIAVDGR